LIGGAWWEWALRCVGLAALLLLALRDLGIRLYLGTVVLALGLVGVAIGLLAGAPPILAGGLATAVAGAVVCASVFRRPNS
jgi:hypothetical protein